VRIGGSARLTGAFVHVFAGFPFIGFTDAHVTLHIRVGWRCRRNHLSGIGPAFLHGRRINRADGSPME
jgi:hypothetical protein